MDNLLYWLWLSLVPNLGAARKHFLIKLFGGPKEVYDASAEALKQVFESYSGFARCQKGYKNLCGKNLRQAEINMAAAQRKNIEIISFDSPSYPQLLRTIEDAPLAFFAAGNIELLNTRCLAVVGTRRASPYGRWTAAEIAKKCASCDITIVSGMAEGIDASAHRGCLSCGGNTIAVLGTGVDVCFPLSNAELYEQILEQGLVISEYPMGSPGYPANFPERNRIISGLSRDCIIVEGALKSGSMITAGLAAEQGRNVFAVPGNINQPGSAGTNLLISEGVPPITSMNSLLKTLDVGMDSASIGVNLSPQEKELYDFILRDGSASREFILSKQKMAPSEAAALLSALELKGLIRQEGSLVYLTRTN